jgi:hypothetical protein
VVAQSATIVAGKPSQKVSRSYRSASKQKVTLVVALPQKKMLPNVLGLFSTVMVADCATIICFPNSFGILSESNIFFEATILHKVTFFYEAIRITNRRA